MNDKPEVMEKPPAKKETPIITVPETRDCLVMALAWECPFCKRMNGIPEVDRCKCGARRIGSKAVK
jgi:hypothetical protein